MSLPLLLWLAGIARAEPTALRVAQPTDAAATVAVGVDRVGVAVPLGGELTAIAGVHGRPPAVGSVGAGVAWQHRLTGGDQGGLTVQIHGELLGLLATPGLGVGVGAAVVGRVAGPHLDWTASLAAPASLRVLGPSALDRPESRVPLMAGTALGIALPCGGAGWTFWPGPWAQAGPVFSPGGPTALDATAGVSLSWSPGSRP